ncbi:MAG: DivIVA domain-containing protein [Actinomyces sp.]|nr:MAG: DivIVA domain-containing protein [Actinomyces sp.]
MDALNALFENIEFSERWRGYDPAEVDAYVERVARAAALVQGRLRELQQRVEAAEARLAGGGGETEETLKRTLVLAQRTADAAVAEARATAEALVAEARERAERLVGEAEARSAKARSEAEATAAALLHDAEERASRLLAEAETDRRRILAEAEREADAAARAARDRLADEVRRLEELRAFLADDVELLESHLATERERLRREVAALSRLVDDPEALRAAPAPATSGVVVPPELFEPGAPSVGGAVGEPSDEEPTASDESLVASDGEPTATYEEVSWSLDGAMPPPRPDDVVGAEALAEPASLVTDVDGMDEEPEPLEVPFTDPGPAGLDGGEVADAHEVGVASGAGGGTDEAAPPIIDLTEAAPPPPFVTAADLDAAGDAPSEAEVPADPEAAGESLADLPPTVGFDEAGAAGEAWAEVAWADETADGAAAERGSEGDRYLDQLRALDDDEYADDEDPLSLFFAGDEGDEGRSGWLGRRR